MRRWRVTFSRHPDSARDGAGRGTGRRPAAGAAPLSGQGLRGWDLPSAHRRQARRPGAGPQRQAAGGADNAASGGGHGEASARRQRAWAQSDGRPGPQGHLQQGWPGTAFRPQSRAPWHLPRRARLRTVLRGPPLAKRACRGQCRPTGHERVQGRGCTSSTFVSWTAGLGRAHSRCSVNIGVDWPDLQRPRSRLQHAPSGRLSQAVRTVAQAAAHAAPPPPAPGGDPMPPWAGLRSGRPLSPAAFAWPVPPRWAGGFGRHPSKPRPRRPVLRDMERDSHGRGPEASPVDGPTASTSEWPGPLHRASAPGGHAGAERAPPGPAVQAGGFQAETRAPGGAPAHSAGLPAPASARDLAPFTLICLICRARPTPF